jgi:hypothetical protein
MWPPPGQQAPPGYPPGYPPAYGGGPPGWQPPPWPPPPGQRTGPRWYVIAGVIAAAIAVFIAAAIVFVPRIVHTVLGPRTGATLYLTALRRNDINGAYTFACPDIRARYSVEEFGALITAGEDEVGRVTRFSVTSSQVTSGTPFGRAGYTVHTSKGRTIHTEALMYHDGVLWTWCGSSTTSEGFAPAIRYP